MSINCETRFARLDVNSQLPAGIKFELQEIKPVMKILSLLILVLGLHVDLKSQRKHIFHSKDPVYTTDNHKIDPEKNLDGSNGKYAKHKRANNKKFIKNRRTKPVRAWNGREK